MKYILFCLLPIIFAFDQGTNAVEWLTDTIHDFGDIPHDKPVTYNFEFKNTSEEPIIIDTVRPNCGCTTPDWSFDPIPAGSKSTIKVIYDAKNPGYFRKKIKVFFSNQRKSEILYVEGYVE